MVPDDDDQGYLLKTTSFRNLNHDVPDNVDLLPKVVQLNSFSTDVNQDDAIELAGSATKGKTTESNYRISIDHSTQTDFEPRYSFESNEAFHSQPRDSTQTEHRNSTQSNSRLEVQPFITEIESLIGSIGHKSRTELVTTLYRHSATANPNAGSKEFSIDQVSLD